MRDQQVIAGFQEHDRTINILHRRIKELEKTIDKAYHVHLTHVMMWDALLGLLATKGVVTKAEFDSEVEALGKRTKAAMEAYEKKEAESKAKVTVVSDTPAIEVVH